MARRTSSPFLLDKANIIYSKRPENRMEVFPKLPPIGSGSSPAKYLSNTKTDKPYSRINTQNVPTNHDHHDHDHHDHGHDDHGNSGVLEFTKNQIVKEVEAQNAATKINFDLLINELKAAKAYFNNPPDLSDNLLSQIGEEVSIKPVNAENIDTDPSLNSHFGKSLTKKFFANKFTSIPNNNTEDFVKTFINYYVMTGVSLPKNEKVLKNFISKLKDPAKPGANATLEELLRDPINGDKTINPNKFANTYKNMADGNLLLISRAISFPAVADFIEDLLKTDGITAKFAKVMVNIIELFFPETVRNAKLRYATKDLLKTATDLAESDTPSTAQLAILAASMQDYKETADASLNDDAMQNTPIGSAKALTQQISRDQEDFTAASDGLTAYNTLIDGFSDKIQGAKNRTELIDVLKQMLTSTDNKFAKRKIEILKEVLGDECEDCASVKWKYMQKEMNSFLEDFSDARNEYNDNARDYAGRIKDTIDNMKNTIKKVEDVINQVATSVLDAGQKRHIITQSHLILSNIVTAQQQRVKDAIDKLSGRHKFTIKYATSIYTYLSEILTVNQNGMVEFTTDSASPDFSLSGLSPNTFKEVHLSLTNTLKSEYGMEIPEFMLFGKFLTETPEKHLEAAMAINATNSPYKSIKQKLITLFNIDPIAPLLDEVVNSCNEKLKQLSSSAHSTIKDDDEYQKYMKQIKEISQGNTNEQITMAKELSQALQQNPLGHNGHGHGDDHNGHCHDHDHGQGHNGQVQGHGNGSRHY
jgi:hypothetical protein